MVRQIPGGPLFEPPSFDSIHDLLASSADSRPDHIAIKDPQPDGTLRAITYRDLRSDVDSMARAMLSESPGPVVGVVGRNSIQWAVVYLAALRAGGVVVPIDRELPIQEMRAILHYAGAGMFFLDYPYLQDFSGDGHARSLPLIVMNSEGDCGTRSFQEMIETGRKLDIPLPSSYDLDAPAAIYYTSGTMGQAKGVVLTQNNLMAVVRQMLQMVRMLPDDIFLSVLPMHHTYECSCGFLGPLSSGATYHICRGLRYVGEDIVSSGATIVLAVPLLWEAMYRKIRDAIKARRGGALKFRIGMAVAEAVELVTGTSVRKRLFAPVHQKLGGRNRLMISGGAGIDPEVVKGFLKLGFTFLQGYGLTEASPLVSVNRIGANRIGSVGPPMPEIDVLIEEPDEDGVGEILIKGPNVMLGYHNDPEETAKVLDGEGWLRTGDFGYLDRDGYLYITGRKKNVIVAKNGKNVYPEEIETRLGKSDLVLECMIFGQESKSKGEEIWAIVVPDTEQLIAMAEREGAALTREFAAEAVRREIRHFNSTQPIYKHIANFMIRDEELPKTTTKKIRRREILREAGLAPEAVMRV